jgi:CheY-like chemotaxis protein
VRIVAVVDDSSDNRTLVRALLEDFYTIRQYPDGPSALAAFDTDRPDAVLLDISMPGMDGVEALAQMRANPRLCDIPAIALTAYAMSGDREKYLAAGFDGYVTKPIIDEQLLLDSLARCFRLDSA